MRNVYSLLLLLAAGALFTGCIRNTNQVVIKKDGTGTVAVSMLVSDQLAEMNKGEEEGPIVSKEDLEKMATNLGEGVTLTEFKDVKRDGFQGVDATFAVADITKLRYKPQMDSDEPVNEAETYRFKLETVDGVSKLTITPPDQKEPAEGEAEAEGEAAEAPAAITDEEKAEFQQTKAMMAGLLISMTVKVEGEIVKTNATFKDEDGAITLMYMNLDDIEVETMATLKTMGDAGPAEAVEAKGIKVESAKKELVIEFK